MAYVSEKFSIAKSKAAWLMGVVMTCVGLVSVFGIGQNAQGNMDTLALNAIDTFTGQVMLPLAGLLIILFVGWRLDRAIIAGEFSGSERLGNALLFLTRYVAPIFVGLVFLSSVYGAYFA